MPAFQKSADSVGGGGGCAAATAAASNASDVGGSSSDTTIKSGGEARGLILKRNGPVRGSWQIIPKSWTNFQKLQ
jgi:hypothetical protein